jgi:hypothetical protein
MTNPEGTLTLLPRPSRVYLPRQTNFADLVECTMRTGPYVAHCMVQICAEPTYYLLVHLCPK